MSKYMKDFMLLQCVDLLEICNFDVLLEKVSNLSNGIKKILACTLDP